MIRTPSLFSQYADGKSMVVNEECSDGASKWLVVLKVVKASGNHINNIRRECKVFHSTAQCL